MARSFHRTRGRRPSPHRGGGSSLPRIEAPPTQRCNARRRLTNSSEQTDKQAGMNATSKRLPRRISAALTILLMFPVVGLTGAWAIGRAGIYNMGPTANIGVVHNWSYPNRYDAIIPVGRSTSGLFGWLYAVGFYTGAGWCTNYYSSAAGGNDSTGLFYAYRWTVRGPTFASKPWADDGAVYSYPC